MPGQEAVQSVNGPIAWALPDLELYCRAVLGGRPWLRDPRCLPLPWRPVELAERLRVAVMWHDGMVQPTPPVARALRQVVGRLRAAGHDVVDWDPADQKHGVALLGRMFVADGGAAIRREVERTGEPWRPELDAFLLARELGVSDMWKLQAERTEFQNRYLDRWGAAGIDAILCPTMAFNAVENGGLKHGEPGPGLGLAPPGRPVGTDGRHSRVHGRLQRPGLFLPLVCDRTGRRQHLRRTRPRLRAAERRVRGHPPRM